MNFYLTTKAQGDLKNIAIYTEKNWGIRQRNIYLEAFNTAFHLIIKSPEKGRSCDYIKTGYRKYYVGKHVIFYHTKVKEEILVVRILHVSMDIEEALIK